MDQLRTALAWLKKNHFWVLSVLVALIAVGCWWKASGKMQASYKVSETTITSEFKNVSSLRSDPFHPNQDVNDKQAAETKKQAEGVAKLWEQLYERQREEVLKWPVPPLSKEFGDAVEKLQFGAEIPATLRRNYQNYVQGHFPELPKQIDARPYQGTSGAGGGGRGFGGPEGGGPVAVPGQLSDENDYTCQWLDPDQSVIHDELYFRDQPSSLRIWVTQEDLWVYHTLLRVISKTNKAANSTRMSNAAVKMVAELAIGQRAAKYSRTPGRLMVPPPTAQAGTVGPEGGTPPAPGVSGPGPEGGQASRAEFSPDRMNGGGAMTDEQERAYLLYGRYLDAQGKPIPFGNPGGGGPVGPDAAAAAPAEAAAGPPAALDLTVFGQEYKRLPVRMVLQMDQRWLPRLIAECASEPLQVEVQEVRVNVADLSATGGGPMGGGSRGFAGGGPNSASLFPEESTVLPFKPHPEVVDVIIQGTIYIFNKPNPSVLQTGDQPPLANNGG